MTGTATPPRNARRLLAPALAAVLAVAGVVVLVMALLGGGPTAPEPAAAAPGAQPAGAPAAGPVGDVPPGATPEGPVLSPAPPAEITIPAIGVASPVERVGLNPDGTLGVPAPGPLYDRAAWYTGSSAPGFRGPSVILGHVDSAKNGPSVFFDLGKMEPGQEIVVRRTDGIVATFVVDQVRSFPKNTFPSRSVYADVDRAELRLITCGGEFDSAAHSYRDNTVVFAHLTGSRRG
ncbi:class F sortase [Pseudonocardia phyllosphaerae]|uniref:class F sortase n=1 Tax=Pseudonocardia phyllosphaerae TaxID=3390502 RepID=UPI00397C3580